MTTDRKEIVRKLEDLGLLDKQQITKALASPYDYSDPDKHYPVCSLTLIGISGRLEADMVSLSVSVDGNVVKTAEVPVVSGETDNYRIVLGDEIGSRFSGKQYPCIVSGNDKYGRELFNLSYDLQFGGTTKAPSITAKASFAEVFTADKETGKFPIIEGSVCTDMPATVSVSAVGEKGTIWQSALSLDEGQDSPFTIMADESQLSDGELDTVHLVIRFNDEEIFSDERDIRVEHAAKAKVSKQLPKIVGDLVLPKYVDVHKAVNGSVPIGSLVLFNKGEDTDIIVSVTLDGNNLYLSRDRFIGEEKEIDIHAPFTKLARDSTTSREIVSEVRDSDGELILYKVMSLKVRSKYDMDLNEICMRTAQFVNPANGLVKMILDDADGPLADAMEGRYSIVGYQHHGSSVIRQMKAVYDMLNGWGMRYVSDTFTFNKFTESYQHVRTPDKVLEDSSGNCLELSILFASFYEAMGLEPVIAFPPGHAIVGVVLSTNIYPSNAECVEDEELDTVTLSTPDGSAKVLFVEATACPGSTDFNGATQIAYKIIIDNLQSVCEEGNYIFLKRARMIGIDPIPNL